MGWISLETHIEHSLLGFMNHFWVPGGGTHHPGPDWLVRSLTRASIPVEPDKHVPQVENKRSPSDMIEQQHKSLPKKMHGSLDSSTTQPQLEEQDEDENTWSPIQLAAAQGELSQVTRLLAQPSVDPNEPAKGYYGQTALQAASQKGHLAVVETLLAAGAEANAPGGNNGGRTAVVLASGAGHLNVVRRLVSAGADINRPPHRYSGRTALQAAAEGGHMEVFQWLLKQGADINAPAGKTGGRTALQAAASGGHAEIVEILIRQNAPINAPAVQHKGFTALQAAAFGGHHRVVRRLLDAGANVNAQGSYYEGYTALAAAAECGHYEIVRMLLHAGADASLTSGNKGWTATQIAIFRGQKDIAQLLQRAEQTVLGIGRRLSSKERKIKARSVGWIDYREREKREMYLQMTPRAKV